MLSKVGVSEKPGAVHPLSRWIRNLMERRGYWRAAVAIAAKNARMAWAVLHYGDTFKPEQAEPTGA
ncbi:hypothetical protein PSA3335_08010 [Pseudomonas savastanoi pv. savastanoi NCPPB 3335]|uniref:ISPsy16, transposase n=1 Tax=Pseudomonas savastanoi pv. savastanoi NCPPB 3335 TaxID=693985 RepID=A0ABC8BA68_PSESS|nr:hypothetical protein PSA3335_08010 [Pseudomonas savastanoi pv. savastanoi NCPPB 3335]